ncbi:adenosylcobinamide-GDP ribazoletransferase [Priestia abyssalis]|uniref:adenosylcobinamide-GDP ribazoletransferase n=1 Tax=Priestia abyssalis TaxID=1221450 RepID=UPI000994C0DD|nr:adenosylcobinamide-GDP ribazoletransferase [Priestia abyssalis]
MKEWVNTARMALQFYTIFPAAKTVDWTSKRAARTLLWLPVIGLGIAGFLFFFLLVFESIFSSTAVLALCIVLVGIGLTGGLHLDGWMDVSDAYFSRREKEKKLEILSDPHIGSFAVLSLLFLLSIRWAAIYELLLLERISWYTIAFILVMPRMMAGRLLMTEQTAKEKGLASYFQQGVTSSLKKRYMAQSTLFVVFFLMMAENNIIVLSLLLAMGIFYILYRHFIHKQFGGMTGDTVGAAIEGGETWLWMSSWLLHVFVTG